MRLFLLVGCLCSALLYASCKSNQSDISGEKGDKDSVIKVDLNKKENQIGVFEPPDSTYSGDYFEKYPSGVIKVRGAFRFGKKSGKWMYFYPNGTLWSEAFFHLDKMNGESNVYYTNGKLMYNGFYKMDAADSVWTFYDSTGVVAQKIDYNQKKSTKK